MPHDARQERPGQGQTQLARALAVERSIRDLVFQGGRLVPTLFVLFTVFFALRPMLFEPDRRLDGLLASMAGVGLSFASVTFSAANTVRDRRRWSAAMVDAALNLLRYSLAIVVALALSAARQRLLGDLGSAVVLDWTLRGVMTLVTALAMALAFLGFRSLIYLLGPGLDGTLDPPGDRSATGGAGTPAAD